MTKPNVQSLAQQWAKKYIDDLEIPSENEISSDRDDLTGVVSKEGRVRTAEKLMHSLRPISLQAWQKTESLMGKEARRHKINPRLIDPWEITGDSYRIYDKVLEVYTRQSTSRQLASVARLGNRSQELYEKALEIYTDRIAPSQLSGIIGPDLGAIQKKYTQNDPRVKGFVAMQFHYTSQMLLELLSPLEQGVIGAYFKVMDDYFYMPLQRAYQAVAKLDYDSPAVSAVQQLLPDSTKIAKKICQRTIQLYPGYRSYTGALSDATVRTSSVRDVEMFQVYLWVCVLEGNIAAIQQELFPLCVMLYPILGVKWELLRQMLHLLGQEIRSRLSAREAATFMPYFQALWEMFSPDVFAIDDNLLVDGMEVG